MTAGHRSVALTHYDGSFGALDNRCPHQGGPLGEGTIENGLLRCPWHGYDYCPLTGGSEFGDGAEQFEVELREDGGVWVAVPAEQPHERTVSDVMAETLVAWGVTDVFGMVGHSNLGLADALRRREEAGELRFIGIRHEGAAAFAASAYGKLTGRPAACLTIAGPGATNLLTGLWDAHMDGAPVLALTGQVDAQVLGAGHFQEIDLQGAFGTVATWSQTVLNASRHAELAALAVRHAVLERGVAHLVFPDQVQTLPGERRERRAARGAPARPCDRPARRGAGAGDRSARGRQAPGDHRRHRRSPRARRRDRAGRASRRAGDDDLPREGPDRRRSPARLRDARPQRHADRLLGDERGRCADRDRGLVRQPHGDLRGQADRAHRPRSAAARPHDRASPYRCCPTPASRRAH